MLVALVLLLMSRVSADIHNQDCATQSSQIEAVRFLFRNFGLSQRLRFQGLNFAEILNLDLYSLESPKASEELVSRCRAQLDKEGSFVLADFIRPLGLTRILEEVLNPTPVESEKKHTVFQLPPDPAFAPTHPRNKLVSARIGFVGRTLLPSNGILNQLYAWEPLRTFLSAVANRTLYRSTDTEGSVYAIVNKKHHITAWHFDQSPFSIVLLLQPSDKVRTIESHPLLIHFVDFEFL